MGITDPKTREAPDPVASELDEIETIVGKARDGTLAEDVAFEAIGRIVRRRTPVAETYQKPWG